MSSQKGNTARTRPQKHQNRTAFKNTLHDTSHRTKAINSTEILDVCQRCKEIIEWKIKYKKYKPLAQPKKCVKCGMKTVKKAYHIMCNSCGVKLGICTKCGVSTEIIQPILSEKMQLRLDEEIKELVKALPERKRRTFMRDMNKTSEQSESNRKEDILNRLKALTMSDENCDSLSNLDSDDSGDIGPD